MRQHAQDTGSWTDPHLSGSAKTVLGATHTFTTAAYMLGGGRNEITGVRRLGWSITCALAVSLLAHGRPGQVLGAPENVLSILSITSDLDLDLSNKLPARLQQTPSKVRVPAWVSCQNAEQKRTVSRLTAYNRLRLARVYTQQKVSCRKGAVLPQTRAWHDLSLLKPRSSCLAGCGMGESRQAAIFGDAQGSSDNLFAQQGENTCT